MNQAFRLLCAVVALIFVYGASVFAQNPRPTPDPFVAQIGTSCGDSFVNDISGNGRFVVFESTGDLATDKSRHNNVDGNREIFLYDYAQRRVYQITDTKSALKPAASPTPTPTPSPTPSPSPGTCPAPIDQNTIAVEVSNNRPIITNTPTVTSDGKLIYRIVFSSNASNPGNFDGNDPANLAALNADGNQEIWIYELPPVDDVSLSGGADVVPPLSLDAGTFTRVTNTPASRLPLPGSTTTSPFVADDNRDAAINDDGSIIAFVSTRDLVTGSNGDGNPEIFIFNRNTGKFTQVTNTQGALVFNENPSLNGSGTVLAFISNSNITGENNDDGKGNGNAEIFVANFDGAAASNIRQVTHTTSPNPAVSVNILSPGRRLSRDGNLLAFESSADLAGAGAIQPKTAVFIYNISAKSFTQVGPRAPSNVSEVLRFPTFTGDSSTIVFASGLNFKTDGTFPTTATDGLNPNTGAVQIFSAPVSAPNTFTRLTNNPPSNLAIASLQPFTTSTTRRLSFSLGRTELGGGIPSNQATQAFYLLVPPLTSETPASANAISYSTGASNIPVAGPSPSPTPTASPAPGLAPGELSIARSATALAPSSQMAGSASESSAPPLPIELNGVSVSVNGAAAGLYFVSPGEIDFVVPVGLAPSGTNGYPVVVNNNGAVIRSTLQVVAAQPDIFAIPMGPGGRAVVCNVTNMLISNCMGEPFSVMSTDSSGNTVPTVLEINLTGVRKAQPSQVKVTIGTVDITGDAITLVGPNTNMFGHDRIDVKLPASLAGAGDVPIIVTVTISGQTFSSRPAEAAPHITINP